MRSDNASAPRLLRNTYRGGGEGQRCSSKVASDTLKREAINAIHNRLVIFMPVSGVQRLGEYLR